VSESALSRKILVFASIVEAATGLALIADPAAVVGLLLGAASAEAGLPVARCFGVALLALGWACWPGRDRAAGAPAAAGAMLIYNTLIALYLGYLGGMQNASGPLLWPAVILHAAVALLLAWTRRRA
jgi:hypothetical protein